MDKGSGRRTPPKRVGLSQSASGCSTGSPTATVFGIFRCCSFIVCNILVKKDQKGITLFPSQNFNQLARKFCPEPPFNTSWILPKCTTMCQPTNKVFPQGTWEDLTQTNVSFLAAKQRNACQETSCVVASLSFAQEPWSCKFIEGSFEIKYPTIWTAKHCVFAVQVRNHVAR